MGKVAISAFFLSVPLDALNVVWLYGDNKERQEVHTMYFIFDCTKAQGYAFSTQWKWLAVMGSGFLTKVTGRVHDFEKMPCS